MPFKLLTHKKKRIEQEAGVWQACKLMLKTEGTRKKQVRRFVEMLLCCLLYSGTFVRRGSTLVDEVPCFESRSELFKTRRRVLKSALGLSRLSSCNLAITA